MRFIRSHLILVLLLAGESAPLYAINLAQAYQAASFYDSQIAAARDQLVAVQEKIPQARAGLLPVINLSGSTGWNETDSIQNTSGSLRYNSHGYVLQLTQPLFRWDNWVQYDQSKLLVIQAQAQYTKAQEELILRVSQAYFDVLLAQDTLAFTQAQAEATSQQLSQAKRGLEMGTATIVDTYEAKARYDLIVAQEIAVQNDITVKKNALQQIIGMDPGALMPLNTRLPIENPQPDDLQQWVDISDKNNADVIAAEAGFQAASRQVDRVRAGHYPTVDFVASRNYNKGDIPLGAAFLPNEATTNMVGVQMDVPIYQGGSVSSRGREAQALKSKANNDRDTARRLAQLSANQAYLNVKSGIAQISALEAALISNQAAVDANKRGYELGTSINIDVLNAQQQYFSTRRDLAKVRYDTLISLLRLREATGALNDEDIAQINALLDR